MGVGEGRGFLPTLPGERSYKWENAELIRKREETPGATLSLLLSLSFPYCHVSTRSPRVPHTQKHQALSYYFSSFSRYICPLALLPSTQRFFSLQHALLYLSAISVICASAPALFVLYSRYALSEFVLEILLETFCSRGKRAINLILFHPTPLCTFSLSVPSPA